MTINHMLVIVAKSVQIIMDKSTPTSILLVGWLLDCCTEQFFAPPKARSAVAMAFFEKSPHQKYKGESGLGGGNRTEYS